MGLRQTASPREKKLSDEFVSELLAPPKRGSRVVRERRFENLDITGSIDLSRVSLEWPVAIENCSFQDINLTEASIPELALCRCTFRSLTARHLEIFRGDLDLQGSEGTIDISGAHIRDDIHLTGAHVKGDPIALRADGIHIGGDFDCKSTQEDTFRCDGTLSLYEADIAGSLNLQYAQLEAPEGERTLRASQIKIGGELEADHLRSRGVFYMIGAQIVGELDLSGAQISTEEVDEGHATGIRLDRCHVGGSLFCDDGFFCKGGLRGIGLDIDGSAYFDGATLIGNPTEKETPGKALELDRSHIRGVLRLCRCRNPDHCPIEEGVAKEDAAELRSTRDIKFAWSEAYLSFASDGVISLPQLTVDCRTHIETGDLHGGRSPEYGDSDSILIAVDLNQLRTQMLVLNGGPGVGSGPPRDQARIDLTGATLGILLDYLIDTETKETAYPTILKDCTYSFIHQAADQGVRLEWLSKGSTLSRHLNSELEAQYRSDGPFGQPYQQVADASGRAENDAFGRTVLWRMNKAVNGTRVRGRAGENRGRLSRVLKRAWNRFQDVAIGYGYRPGRAALWLLGLWMIGVITFWHSTPTSRVLPPRGMSSVEHITYPLDLIIPLHALGQQSQWHPVGLYPQALAAGLTVFGWIFSITIVTAITRIARRS